MGSCSGICGGLTELGKLGRVLVDGRDDDWWATFDSGDLGTHQGRGPTAEEALDQLWTKLRATEGYEQKGTSCQVAKRS
jgi:hypothetical protein